MLYFDRCKHVYLCIVNIHSHDCTHTHSHACTHTHTHTHTNVHHTYTHFTVEDNFSDIQRELQGLESIYYNLGRNLHLTSDRLDIIQKNNPNDCVTAFSKVIDEWLRMNYNVPKFGRPSWQLLVNCVDAMDHDRAEAIANKHIVEH